MVLLLCSVILRSVSDRRISLMITASTGEILRYAQNDRVVFWFCFYVLVILRELSDRRISLTVTATTGEILSDAQNDRGMFSFRFLLRQTPICRVKAIIHLISDLTVKQLCEKFNCTLLFCFIFKYSADFP